MDPENPLQVGECFFIRTIKMNQGWSWSFVSNYENSNPSNYTSTKLPCTNLICSFKQTKTCIDEARFSSFLW